MYAVNTAQDVLVQLLDRGIGVGGVLRLIGLIWNGVRGLQGLDNGLLLVGIRVSSSVCSKSL
jgi:hypothetical protein